MIMGSFFLGVLVTLLVVMVLFLLAVSGSNR